MSTPRKLLSCVAFLCGLAPLSASASLPVKYEELNAPEVIQAVKESGGVCLLPFGILEKHAAHLPLETDLLMARQVAKLAAEKEYCAVFPPYYFGQINEARHQPGTIAYSSELIWKLLQETCTELSRNGFKKIIIVNGHGGNNDFLRFFALSQLNSPKDYSLVIFNPEQSPETVAKVTSLKKTTGGGHADEEETSMILSMRPDLVKPQNLASTKTGEDQQRLASVPHQYTGIWWYARFPNHYAGDGSKASVELGKLLIDSDVEQLVELIKVMKTSNTIGDLQDKFYKESAEPLKTQQ